MDYNKELFEFIKKSPTAFHTTDTVKNALVANGYTQLYEEEEWKTVTGKHFVCKNQSSIIAFHLPSRFTGFHILATHTDQPSFKLKFFPHSESCGVYSRLNTEKYGGAILSSWLDRPLSIAGRITRAGKNGLETQLVNADNDLCLIPNIAIHLDRSANEGKQYNLQTDMLPLYGNAGETISDVIDTHDMLSCDLYLYNRQEPVIFGAKQEFIAAPRLDNLQCTFAALNGFLSKEEANSAAVFCAFDNEEVGSASKQGADSAFLDSTLRRITEAAGRSYSDYQRLLASSFFLSADNAHAVHPNHPELSDENNRPLLNGGIVVKYNAAQRYTTDSVSAAVVMTLCEMAGVPYQAFANRSDILGGSTLGAIASTHLPVNTADIGLAQLAMHSAYETAGAYDTEALCKMAKQYFSVSIHTERENRITIK